MKGTDSGQQAAGSRQRAADSRQRAAGSGQPAVVETRSSCQADKEVLSQRPGNRGGEVPAVGRTALVRALNPGEPFFSKVLAPNRFIAGGEFLAHSTITPVSVAWAL
jgi:hypothetical protein